MKRIFIKFLVLSILAGITVNKASAQQQSIVNLILTGFNEAHTGFPTFIKDTASDSGGREFKKINQNVVKQYANVKDINLNLINNYKSLLIKDTLVHLNQMTIRSENIVLGENKTWDDYKDTLTSYYNKQVDFFIKAFGAQLNYTPVIPLQNEEDAGFKPRYCIYFYEKSIKIHDTLTNMYEIEKQLDVVAWFSIELQKNILISRFYNMVYRISGGQRQ